MRVPVLLLALAALGACRRAAPAPTFAGPASTDQVTVGMTLRLSEAGQPQALLQADTAVTPVGATRSDLVNVRLTFKTAGGKDGTLTSERGIYDPATQEMIATGDVVLVVPGEAGQATRTIRSQELHWNQAQDRVWSTVETSMEEAGRLFYTQGFESDSRFTNVRGTNSRSGDVRVGEGGLSF